MSLFPKLLCPYCGLEIDEEGVHACSPLFLAARDAEEAGRDTDDKEFWKRLEKTTVGPLDPTAKRR